MKYMLRSRPQRAHVTGMPRKTAQQPLAYAANQIWTAAPLMHTLCPRKASIIKCSKAVKAVQCRLT
jgi:hypothetical protein